MGKSRVTKNTRSERTKGVDWLYVFRCMFVHKVLFEFLAFKHPRLLLVSPSDTSTGGGLLGVKFLASENWCGRVHFGGHSPKWRVLAKFSVQPCKISFRCLCIDV